MPLLDRLEDLVATLVHVLVPLEHERSPTTGTVTFLAVLLKQRHDLPVERHLGRGGCRTGHDGAEQDQEHEQDDGAHALLRAPLEVAPDRIAYPSCPPPLRG